MGSVPSCLLAALKRRCEGCIDAAGVWEGAGGLRLGAAQPLVGCLELLAVHRFGALLEKAALAVAGALRPEGKDIAFTPMASYDT